MRVSRHIQPGVLFLLALVSFLGFVLFLGKSQLFDWDEINFAESAREMLRTGNYFQVQIDFEPFWEKPPLFIWMQAFSMKIFGVNEFAARFPNAMFGLFTITAIYWQGTRIKNNLFGLMTALLYMGSLLPALYFKSGIIDPVFNFFIFLGIMHIMRFEMRIRGDLPENSGQHAPMWAGVWLGLATLTKGPVGLLVPALVYLVYKALYDRFRLPWAALGRFLGVYLLMILSWFGSIYLFTPDGGEIITKFISYQADLFSSGVAGHSQPFYYHFVIFLVGCFPMSAFAFRGMFERSSGAELSMRRFMLIWFWVVMILFSIVQTKIVHYSSMLYFPGAFLGSLYLYRLMRRKEGLKADSYVLYGLGMLIFGIAVSLVNLAVSRLPEWAEKVKDPFARENLLTPVDWSGWEFIPGLLFTLGLCAGLYLLIKRKFLPYLLLQAGLTLLYLNSLNLMIVPKVSQYTQASAVEFFQKAAYEDAYIIVEGYKSYAQFFYGRVEPFPFPEIPKDRREDWMRTGEIDRPVYLITKIHRMDEGFLERNSEFKEVKREAGFVFFVRRPQGSFREGAKRVRT